MSEKNSNNNQTKPEIMPSEFKARMDSITPKGEKNKGKVKNFFINLLDTLSALGFLPVLTSGSTKKGHHGHPGGMHSQQSASNFRASQRVETPPKRTHEQWLIDEMAHQAYHDMVDGKGDHDCDHEH